MLLAGTACLEYPRMTIRRKRSEEFMKKRYLYLVVVWLAACLFVLVPYHCMRNRLLPKEDGPAKASAA